MKDLDEESDEYKKLDAEKKKIGTKMTAMQKQFHVVFADIRELTEEKAKVHGIAAVFALSKAEDINRAVESVLYGDGKHLHFHKRNDLPLLRAKQSNRAIIMKLDKNEKLFFFIDGIGSFYIKKPKQNPNPKKTKTDWFLH